MDNESFLPLLQGFAGGAISSGLFKAPIQTLQDWWYVNYGYELNSQANLLRAKQEANIEAYKTEILKEVSKINSENIKEPELKILGPSLEASKYYVEEEPLRIMFARLIAASMDKSKDNRIHSSFVEIIKQLTSLDAENLLKIHETDNKDSVCEIHINFSDGTHKTIFTNVYLGNKNELNQTKIGASLDNLRRLGLINISYNHFFSDKAKYEAFYKTPEFYHAKEIITKTNNEYDDIRTISGSKNQNIGTDFLKLSGPEVAKGLIEISPFGLNFCSTCL